MIKNYFKIAWRNLIKNKTYSLLNIVGLSAGLMCFSFIALWVMDELSFDRFNDKADRIFRVNTTLKTDAETFDQAVSSIPMAGALKNDYPEIEETVRFDFYDKTIVQIGNEKQLEKEFLVTDPSFFDVFSYKMTQGDAKTALSEPYSIILTESMAKKHFPNSNPMGQFLTLFMYDTIGQGKPFKITGIMPDAPQNAHITFNYLVSFKSLEAVEPTNNWGNNGFFTYILLKKEANAKAFESRLPAFEKKYINRSAVKFIFHLEPLTDIHFGTNIRYQIKPTSDISAIYIFGIIGLFILLIAAINYMNLATARSMQRAKEVGVKKVLGALKKQLITQYLFESVMTAFVSLGIAVLVSMLLQPLFYQLTAKNIGIFNAPFLLVTLFGVTLLLGFLSGLYPAFFISNFKPIAVLKGSFKATGEGSWLRKSLVIVQFSITTALIIGILIVNAQMSFIQNKDLGFQKDALLYFNLTNGGEILRGYPAFKNELESNPAIQGVSYSMRLPLGDIGNSGASTVDGSGKAIETSTYRLRVDFDFMRVLGLKLLAGRDFSPKFATDTTQAYILNETAIKAFGWQNAENALGKPFKMGAREGKVIGVVKDFHFTSLQKSIEPIAIHLMQEQNKPNHLVLKMDMGEPTKTIAWLQKVWAKHFPDAYLDYAFMDKSLQNQYKTEARFSKIFFIFSILSLLIACLGLYGLIAFTAEQRTKEIGIRKVLGASVPNIIGLISKDFMILVAISILIASPIAYYFMSKWLQDFAYRIDISWWIFTLAGFMALFVALLTVSFQAIKAAVANPVKSLRTE